MLEGLRGEVSIAELCRKEGINQNLYYRWSKEFLEAGKKRLAGDTAREATSDEVKELKAEARQLKETLAEVLIENRVLKKSVLGDGENASWSTPHPRSSRSSSWSSNRPCRSAEPWHRLGFQVRRSTTGTADIRTGGSRLWRTEAQTAAGLEQDP